jgi:segregation and condensation protein A
VAEAVDYAVKLNVFEGPLDLLLFLIKKNEIDIYDIPIALITEQYMAYVEAMKSLNLDMAGEYLVLASTLVHIKSKMLLPPAEEGEEEEEDPRDELVRQLLEYKAYKEAALNLGMLHLLGRDVFGRHVPPGEITEGGETEFREIGIFELVEVFRKLIVERGHNDLMEIDVEKMSLADRISEIMDELNEKKVLTFDDLMGESGGRTRVIYTFLAVLELMKLRLVRVYQSVPYGTIRLFAATGE